MPTTESSSWERVQPGGAVRGVALDTGQAIRRIACAIEGLREVRVLDRKSRNGQRTKVFVILDTHDIDRDDRIIKLLCQLDDVDIDLVPSGAEGMVPVEATPVRLH